MPFTGNDPELHEAEMRGYREAEAAFLARRRAEKAAREAELRAGPRRTWLLYLLRDRVLGPLVGRLKCLGMILVVLGVIAMIGLLLARILAFIARLF